MNVGSCNTSMPLVTCGESVAAWEGVQRETVSKGWRGGT